jgi:type IV conjugative transfer system coupling protein TraD
MLNQVIKKVSVFCILLFIITSILFFYWNTTEYERYLCLQYLIAKCNVLINAKAKQSFINPNGQAIQALSSQILEAEFIQTTLKEMVSVLIKALMVGFIVKMLAFSLMYYWLKMKGQGQSEDNIIKGDRILNWKETKRLIQQKKQDSKLVLGGLPLIKNTETAHLFFHGTTGTGKSNAIKELLDQIRERGDRAIIYDKSCNFLEEFFEPRSDILLNPLDNRGKAWDLWLECRDSADFDNLAAAQIPMPSVSQDPFWVNAARTIFSAAAFEMRHDPKRSIIKLLQYLLTADLNLIQTYLKGTEAEVLVSEKGEKTAISIKSVLATYLKSLKYVRDGNPAFSIRQWIQGEQEKNWLFITSLGDRHETLKPLISSWIDIAVNALLSLPPNSDRRIWLILDELTSLQPLPYLTQMLSESRKFGGSTVIGIQNYAQLSKSYNADGAREISSLLNTRFMFRQPDPEIAKWSAINFGESIIDEVRQGISYGANSMRDGISINHAEARKAVVSFSEIMSLANLHAYVRLPGDFPVTRVEFQYKARKKKNMGFCNRDIDENRLKEVDQLIETCERSGVISTVTPKKKINKKKETIVIDTDKQTDLMEI